MSKFENALIERIKVAIEKMEKKDGIYGFGIEDIHLDEIFGKRIKISEEYPNGEYDYKWIPPAGSNLIELCKDDNITYYVVKNEHNFHILSLENNHPYCDFLYFSDLDSIPDCVITKLAENSITNEVLK